MNDQDYDENNEIENASNINFEEIEYHELFDNFEPECEEDHIQESKFEPFDEDDCENEIFSKNFEPRNKENFDTKHYFEKRDVLKTHHPNLKKNYFKIIATKEKAYWLGFLYADGCINIDKRKPGSRRLTIRIDKKDEVLIDRFAKAIGFNLLYKKYEKGNNIVGIQIGNKQLTEDLISHGVIPRKSSVIEFPNLLNRDLELAFLLGFFDGDGTQGTTKITSGSKKFIEQIKSHFNIDNKIHLKIGKGKGYDFYLGAELFNEMLDNYQDSRERKRCKFSTENERIINIRRNVWKGGHERKFKLTREELKSLVWNMPKTEIAKKFNVSDRTINKWCKIWNIDTPQRGYWSKKANQKYRE